MHRIILASILILASASIVPSAQAEPACVSVLDGFTASGEICVDDGGILVSACASAYSNGLGADQASVCYYNEGVSLERDAAGSHTSDRVWTGSGCVGADHTEYQNNGRHLNQKEVCAKQRDPLWWTLMRTLEDGDVSRWMDDCYGAYSDMDEHYDEQGNRQDRSRDGFALVCL